MKVSVNLNDIIKVKLTNLGAMKYNAKATKGFNQEKLDEFYLSNESKKEGDSLEGNLYLILSFFSTPNGDVLKDCFEDEEFEVVSGY